MVKKYGIEFFILFIIVELVLFELNVIIYKRFFWFINKRKDNNFIQI